MFERMLDKGRVVIVTTPISQSANDPQAWNQLATGFDSDDRTFVYYDTCVTFDGYATKCGPYIINSNDVAKMGFYDVHTEITRRRERVDLGVL